MAKSYTDNEKLEILRYARDHGVVAAAEHFNILRQLITKWNRQMQVYKPKTPEYPTEKRIEVLRYAAQKGPTAAAKKFNVSIGIIELWNREHKIYSPSIRKFTTENKIEILNYVKKYGLMEAADKYDVHASTIVSWNNKLHIYTLAEPYSEDKKIEILTYARDNGVTAAEQKYDLPQATMLRWNKIYNIYTPRESNYRHCTEEQKIQILQHAKKLYDNLPADIRSANYAFILIAEEYHVTKDQLRKWNNKYKLVPLRARSKAPLSQEVIDQAQAALTSARGRITRASRQSGITTHQIKQMQKDKKISFKKGTDKIKTNPPLGRKKARLIRELIAALQNSK